MQVVTTEKRTSWPDRLEEMDVGQVLIADYEKKNSVRAAINAVCLKSGKKYRTQKKMNNSKKFLEVERVK